MKKISAVILALTAAVVSTVPTMASEITIGYSLKSIQEERWQRELDGCIEKADDLGVEFVYQVANGDVQKQISQIETMITEGTDVIMVTAVDAGGLTAVLEEARERGIKILVYDQQLQNSYGDAFIGYDDFDNGVMIASPLEILNVTGNVVLLHGDKASGMEKVIDGEKSVLDKLDVNVEMELYCQNWTEENAYICAQETLKEYNNTIAAFVCMNDNIASGALKALEEVGKEGEVVVTGMDCELTALRRIARGIQTSSVFKDSSILSATAIETAVELAKGERIQADQVINFGENDMPQVTVKSVVITKDNMNKEIINKGYYTYSEIYGE